jgi:polyisoprenoid-binding protein YceI
MKRLSFALAGVLAAVTASAPYLVGSTNVLAADGPAKPQAVKYAAVPAGDYTIDPAHSIIGFSIRHLEINFVEGRFKDFTGTIHLDDADVTRSTVEFTAKIESIDTGVAQRDTHLKTPDFFEAAKFPEMTFKSTKVEKKGKDHFVLTGDFTLKGVTKSISFPFTMTGAVKDPWGNTRFGISAETQIDRRDYGITWGHALESGGLDVGNQVAIGLKLEALKPGPKPAQ